MSDETKASAAERLASDPLLVEALANIRHAALKAWEGTAIADAQARDFAWLTVKVVNRIEAELETIINDGKLAAARVQRPLGRN